MSKYNAFLISAESWQKLAMLVCPEMAALDRLMRKHESGEKISKEEIEDALSFGEIGC